jgi:hypothetical protein
MLTYRDDLPTARADDMILKSACGQLKALADGHAIQAQRIETLRDIAAKALDGWAFLAQFHPEVVDGPESPAGLRAELEALK